MSTWGCPHERDGNCERVNNIPCDPGMKGCVLFGRFVWSNESKNRPAGNPVQPKSATQTRGGPQDG